MCIRTNATHPEMSTMCSNSNAFGQRITDSMRRTRAPNRWPVFRTHLHAPECRITNATHKQTHTITCDGIGLPMDQCHHHPVFRSSAAATHFEWLTQREVVVDAVQWWHTKRRLCVAHIQCETIRRNWMSPGVFSRAVGRAVYCGKHYPMFRLCAAGEPHTETHTRTHSHVGCLHLIILCDTHILMRNC